MIEVKKNIFLLNKEVNNCLNNIIRKKSFANGYIFYGPEGVGKKQTAFQFIKKFSNNLHKAKMLKRKLQTIIILIF